MDKALDANYLMNEKSKIIEIAGWEDDQILGKIQAGDHHAFSILVKRHSSKFYALAYRMLADRENAEDVVQDLFLKLWKNPFLWNRDRAKKHKVKFTTWFYRVVVNRCIDFQKKKKADQLDSDYLDKVVSSDKDSVEEQIDKKERSKMLEKILLELPERQRIAINLCFYQGMSNKEAAEIMNVNIKALESLLMRGKAKLKKIVEVQLTKETKEEELIEGLI